MTWVARTRRGALVATIVGASAIAFACGDLARDAAGPPPSRNDASASASAYTDAAIDAGATPLVLTTTDVIEMTSYAGGLLSYCGQAFSGWVRVDLAARHVARGSYLQVCASDAGTDAGLYEPSIGSLETTDFETDITPAQVATLIAVAATITVTAPECVCCDGEGYTAKITRADASSSKYHDGLDGALCNTAPFAANIRLLYREISNITY